MIHNRLPSGQPFRGIAALFAATRSGVSAHTRPGQAPTRMRLYSLAVLVALTVAAPLLWLQSVEPAQAAIGARVSDVAITSTPASSDTYAADENIQVTVTFDAAVTVTGAPALLIDIGCTKKSAGDCRRTAKYTSGSNTTELVFQYTVKKTDVDTDGISIPENSIRRNDGDIKKGADKVKLIHGEVAADSDHKVNGGAETIGARVSSVAITSTPASGDTYAADENIQVTVTFDAAVTVTGTPWLRIGIGCTKKSAGDCQRKAAYLSGSNTTALVFQHTVKKTDVDTDGISISKNSIRRKDGDIKKGADKVKLIHGEVAADSGHKVNGGAETIGARVSSVAITSTPASGDTYARDENIQVTVTFDAAVTVTGAPRLRIDIDCTKKSEGDCQRRAAYLSGSNTTALVFQHTVKKTDVDTDGISISENSIRRKGGDIKKGADKVRLVHDAIPIQSGHKVNGGS